MKTQSWQWENDGWQEMAGVPLTDRGFRHGMSAFETIKIHRGRLIFLKEHLEKLREACAQLGLRETPDTVFFTSHLSGLALPRSGIARLYVTAGDGTFRAPLNEGRILFFAEEASLRSSLEGRTTPAKLAIAKYPYQSVWASLKTGNYWANIDAYRGAADLQSDEIALVNASQHVISASLANLFATVDGNLLTPRVSSGARAGVMRDWVIAREDVIVTDFHPAQLRDATEIFLTSSAYGLAPIASLEGRPLTSQSLGQKLRNDFLNWLEIA